MAAVQPPFDELVPSGVDTNRLLLQIYNNTLAGPGGGGITALTGDVEASGTGSVAATIANDAVTNAKMANMATATFKGRASSGTGDPEDLTLAQVRQAVVYPTVTDATTARVLALTDAETYIRLTNVAACDITIPNQATVVWLADTEIIFRIANTGIPTVTLGGGVTLNNSAALATMVQHNTFAFKRVAEDVWDLI